MHNAFPLSMGQMRDGDPSNNPVLDFNKTDKGKISASDEDDQSFNDDGAENDQGKGKRVSLWQRVKWTDAMVRLLITAVSYIGEDTFSDCGPGVRRKYVNLQKKGKWKSISAVMSERGFYVSPQQCEDKFNDLNKRYKKLNDILGRGISCEVVENPALLELMDHLSERTKDEVRKILSSKQLFYEAMCSYHNGNRLHLPHDPALQRSLQLALRNKDDHETSDSRRQVTDDGDNDQDADADDQDECEDNRSKDTYSVTVDPAKRMRQGPGVEDFGFDTAASSQELHKTFYLQQQNQNADVNLTLPGGPKAGWSQEQLLKARRVFLEQRKLQIEMDILEVRKQCLEWESISKKRNRELENVAMENEMMKLKNEQMALELKQKEMNMNLNH